MRSSNKSRSRNKNQNRRASTNIVNRVFDSSGPEGKVRGTPQQIVEKYQALARDAQLSGDRVAAEAFQQHAEHYLRLLADAMREQNQRREAHEAQQAQHAQRRDTQNNNSNSQANTAQANTQTNGGEIDANAPVQNDLHNSEQPDIVHAAPETPTPTPKSAPAENAEQPADNGLVETPEDKPRRAPRRAPRKKPQSSDQAAE